MAHIFIVLSWDCQPYKDPTQKGWDYIYPRCPQP